MTVTVDAEGFVRGFEVGRRSYRELQHPPISNTLAGAVLSMPEDAWRITQSRARRTETDAMAGGTILDSLITGPEYSIVDGEHGQTVYVYTSGKQKGQSSVTTWHEWNGLRIVDCDDFSPKSAQIAKKGGKERGLTVVSREDFDRERAIAAELRVRFELAGFRLDDYLMQVSLYWIETARNGFKVQACGRLDFLRKDHLEIVDLKRVESLDDRVLENGVARYSWHRQAAVYTRAVEAVFGTAASWEWLFARTSPVVACTKRPIHWESFKAGTAAWQRAVNDWGLGLQTGLWRGHEANREPINPAPQTLTRMLEDEEANDGEANAA